MRGPGAAVVSLCSVASGQADLFIHVNLSPWDYAAGMLMVTEAGGMVSRLDGRDVRVFDGAKDLLATNGHLHAEALALPAGAVLDVMPGRDKQGNSVHFIKCYHSADTFKEPAGAGPNFCGMDLERWLETVGTSIDDVWDTDVAAAQRSLWNARMFPIGDNAGAYCVGAEQAPGPGLDHARNRHALPASSSACPRGQATRSRRRGIHAHHLQEH